MRSRYALERYLASPEPKPRFALILQAHSWYPGVNAGSNESLAQEAQRYCAYFALPSYPLRNTKCHYFESITNNNHCFRPLNK